MVPGPRQPLPVHPLRLTRLPAFQAGIQPSSNRSVRRAWRCGRNGTPGLGAVLHVGVVALGRGAVIPTIGGRLLTLSRGRWRHGLGRLLSRRLRLRGRGINHRLLLNHHGGGCVNDRRRIVGIGINAIGIGQFRPYQGTGRQPHHSPTPTPATIRLCGSRPQDSPHSQSQKDHSYRFHSHHGISPHKPNAHRTGRLDECPEVPAPCCIEGLVKFVRTHTIYPTLPILLRSHKDDP